MTDQECKFFVKTTKRKREILDAVLELVGSSIHEVMDSQILKYLLGVIESYRMESGDILEFDDMEREILKVWDVSLKKKAT